MMQRMICQVRLGEAESVLVIDNIAYSPDVATDLVRRATFTLSEAVKLASEYGVPAAYFESAGDGDDEDIAALLADMMEGDEDA